VLTQDPQREIEVRERRTGRDHLAGRHQISTPLTPLAGSLYLWSRVAHAVIYTLAVPWLRTVAFMGGFAAQMLVAWQLLGA
jgi:uncharacterized MAPEG superfamily protein